MKDEKKLDILMEEYKIATERVESFIKVNSSFYWQGLAIVFGLLGIFRDYKEVLIGLPFLITIYVGVVLYNYQRTLTNQVYKRYLEDKINKICGEKLLIYTELGYGKIEKNNKFVKFNYFSYTVLILTSIIAFISYFFKESNNFNDYFIFVITILLIILFILFINAIRDIPKIMDKINKTYIPEILKEEV